MRLAVFLALITATSATPATARPDYLGVWEIAESKPAPWIRSEAELFPEERAELVGKRIVFSNNGIVAPAPMGCRRPHYRLRRDPADMLFQGVLTDPARQAAALGFVGTRFVTLETGCEGLLDYHFLDDNTAMFALNNAIYLVRKAR